ncbi:MAG: FliA/WhiG family RNA polymerase sigma factor [Firmicutes bacterium]|nr:FliA/WhiG family RNA polymerase sigma factor [Bacillota bacterium]
MEPNRQFLDKSNEELFEQYGKTGSLEVKQELVLRYLYIIKSAAIRMRDVYLSFAQMDDIISEGVIMLMNSIDKFEPEKNVKFETYISKRIRGMIIDLARKQDWIPRSTRRNAKMIQEAIEELSAEKGRMPEEHEIAERLGVTTDKFREINSKINLFSVVSLDMMLDGATENKQPVAIPSDIVGEQPEESFLEQEFKSVLTAGIRVLKEKEQMVISLYYVDELNMKQIAEIMEVSEPRVSQIHATAIGKLKDYMENELQLKPERKGE